MGAEVIELSDFRPHLSGAAQCLGCGHKWAAVAPVGTFELECPECGLPKGRFVAAVVRGELHWECACGCDLFRINKNGIVYCPNCGAEQEGY